jgi:glycerophosphoryl diester phosphodiesterase family protein
LRSWFRLSVLVLVMLGLAPSAVAAPKVTPLRQAHAHNDYLHERPLFDALDHGFTSVEADIYLVGDQLLVAHDPEDLRPERTLQSLYLEPLRQRVLDGNGSVYPGHDVGFQLLIDIKSVGEATYTKLDEVQRDPRYAFLFTHYVQGAVQPGAVTAVVSGNRPRLLMEQQQDRFAFYDGRITDPADLGVGADSKLVPLVSDNWTKVFTWNGVGEMPAEERAKLQRIVGDAHAAGQRVRFWATPDAPGAERVKVWKELVAAGADHINTDDLAGLEDFLRDQ